MMVDGLKFLFGSASHAPPENCSMRSLWCAVLSICGNSSGSGSLCSIHYAKIVASLQLNRMNDFVTLHEFKIT